MKKAKQNIMKYHMCNVARMIACVSFLILTILGVSSLVKAMSLEKIENEQGVPAAWKTASLGNPDTITVPITYWDQRQDQCESPSQQFEWVICGYWTKGVIQGLVKDTLGSDGTPVPAFTNADDSWNANRDVFTRNITGNDPVVAGDNFYRWFHDTELSERHEREITFHRTGKNTYEYGGERIFPVDDVSFSDGDSAAYNNKLGEKHNYHFTGHLSVPVKIAADGTEKFSFSGDDDVWVFLNGKLVLDIGGLHEKIDGAFVVNTDGTISTYVQHVNDTSGRAVLGEPSNDFNGYVNPLNEYNLRTFRSLYRGNPATTNPSYQSERYQVIGDPIDVGLKVGDVVNLDFFYAERSTDDANTRITISNMNWPISADSNLESEIVGQTEDKTNIVKYSAFVKNRDPINPVNLERFAAFINENNQLANGTVENNNGFIPLRLETLEYTTTPEDESSWIHVGVSAPQNSEAGFVLDNPILMQKAGEFGDTLYFRYYAETSGDTGNISGKVSFYTSLNGVSGVTYDNTIVSYKPKEVAKHNLKINYRWEDGSKIDNIEDYVTVLPEGAFYEKESPKLENGVLVNEEDVIIDGTMGTEDIEITVYYKKKPVEEKTYRLIVRYKDIDSEEELEAPNSKVLRAEEEYSVESPEIDKYIIINENEKILTGKMPAESEIPENGTVERVVYYRRDSEAILPDNRDYTLTIEYKDKATGEKLTADYVDHLEKDESYSEESPNIPGYRVEPSQAVVEGIMPESDLIIAVFYEKIPKHTVTIHYVYDDGSVAAEDFVEEYAEGDEFSVKSPDIMEHMPDYEIVKDKVADKDLVYTVTYKKIPHDEPEKPEETPKYTVIIKYVYEDGSRAKPDYTVILEKGDDFAVKSPEIEEYTPDIEIVTGVIEEEDLTYTVVYKTEAKVTPDLPIMNNGLGSDVMGDLAAFGYLAPLGEVAYVPNTGVVSKASASAFQQYFADIVLSQGFILIILLIFAISFAIYFSLRKYRDLETAQKIEKDVAKYTKMDKVKDKSAAVKRSTGKIAKDKKKLPTKAETATKKINTKAKAGVKTKAKSTRKAVKK